MVNLKVTYKLIKFTAMGDGVSNDPAQPGKWSLMTSKDTFKWYVHHMHESLWAQLTSSSTLLHPQPCFNLRLLNQTADWSTFQSSCLRTPPPIYGPEPIYCTMLSLVYILQINVVFTTSKSEV